MIILHIFEYIAQSVQGRRTRFQEIIEHSRFSHLVLSSPGVDSDHHQRIKTERGPNWTIKQTLGNFLLEQRGGYWLTYPIFRLQILYEVLKNNIAVIHVHDSDPKSMAGRWAAQYLKIPLIYEVHTLTSSKTIFSNSKKVIVPNRLINRSFNHEKLLVNSAKYTIVQTPVMAKQLLQQYNLPKTQIAVLLNKVDTDRLKVEKYEERRQQLRRQWGVAKNEIVFLYAGYINWYNGLQGLLSAFKAMKYKGQARLIIFGDGPLRDEVIDTASHTENIFYFGTVPSSNMPGIYAASDCMVMSRPDCAETKEATPMKLLEAMAMSRIVICSRVDGLMRICDAQVGLIVEPEDIDGLRKMMEYVVVNFDQLEPLRLGARKRIVELMHNEDSSQVLDELYENIVQQ